MHSCIAHFALIKKSSTLIRDIMSTSRESRDFDMRYDLIWEGNRTWDFAKSGNGRKQRGRASDLPSRIQLTLLNQRLHGHRDLIVRKIAQWYAVHILNSWQSNTASFHLKIGLGSERISIKFGVDYVGDI